MGLLAFVGAAGVAVHDGVPRPVYHDELSLLLAADTFAHGRLANPPHRFWQHFESFHVLQQPTYASKYPPGQGLLLAAGQLLGSPVVGVWLGVCAMSAAMVWMIRAFVPPRWALLGGLLCVSQIAVFTYWAQGYWGGALAATGAALAFGSVGRIIRRTRVVSLYSALLLGGGLLILASTRPFEGALVSLAAALPLVAWLRRGRECWARAMAVAVPAGAVLAVGLGSMLVYNHAVTGDMFRAPYTVHDEMYMATPAFVFQPLRVVPEYRHELHRRFYVDYLIGMHSAERTGSRWATMRLGSLARSWQVLVGPVVSVGVVLALMANRGGRGVRLALAGNAFFLVALVTTSWHQPHYAAPLVPLLLLAAVQGTRGFVLRLRPTRHRRDLSIAIVVAAAVAARLAVPDPVLVVGRARSANQAKLTVERHLASLGGEHLVFVRHGRFADIHDEWVANGADIDARPVVFARAMTPPEDAVLRDYYRDRRAWRVDIAVERPGVVDFVEMPAPSETGGAQASRAAENPASRTP